MTTTRSAKVAAAVRSIRAFHALGRDIPPKQPLKDAYNQGTVAAEARARGLNPDAVRKARQFADPAAGYTPAEVDALCRLVLDKQSKQDDGAPVFARTHVVRLLTVKKRLRPALQRKAVENAWSTAELEAEIAARYGSRRDGGRRWRVRADVLGLLAQVEKRCESWRRWAAALPAPPGDGASRPAAADPLPADVRRGLVAADAAVASLHELVTARLRRLKPGRADRYQFRTARDQGD